MTRAVRLYKQVEVYKSGILEEVGSKIKFFSMLFSRGGDEVKMRSTHKLIIHSVFKDA